MNITLEEFQAYINRGAFHRVGLHAIPTVHKQTVTFYCDRLTAHGACIEDCKACVQHIKARLNATDWTAANNVYALYITIMKCLSAQLIEDAHKKAAKPPVNFLGQFVETDALDLLLETLE